MKIFSKIVLVICSIIWLIAITPYEWIYPSLYKIGFLKDEYRYGDLFHLSNLPNFKEEMYKCPTDTLTPLPSKKPIHLYIIGDSFTEPQRLQEEDLPVDKFMYVKWDHVLHFKPDTSAIQILLFESVERHVRQHFEIPVDQFIKVDTTEFIENTPAPTGMAALDKIFESQKTEGQLDLLLFNHSLPMWIRETKAWLTWKWFNRPNEQTTISEDGQHIVYYLDTDSTRFPKTSGFAAISEGYLDTMVTRINTFSADFKKLGFDHVALSIIPNKSTIVMPEYGTYNRLIERIQNHPALAIPTIDVLSDYRKLGPAAYLKSDSHWTCEGRIIWINNTSALLKQLVRLSGQLADTTASVTNSHCLSPVSTRSLISAVRPQ